MANIEGLAAHAHKMWSDWIVFMLQVGQPQTDGSLLIKSDLVSHWRRRAEATYEKLTEHEVSFDRAIARQWLKIFDANRRRRLSDTRKSMTTKKVAHGIDMYITVGFFDDGEPGEVFVVVAKQGSDVASFVNGWAVMVSMALQFGVPWDKIRDKFVNIPDSMLAIAVVAAQESIDAFQGNRIAGEEASDVDGG